MLLSQKLADFSKGDADVLRKAMGKKDRHTLDKLKPQFIENAKKKGHDAKVLEKVWTDWEAFASYAFNKSHSTCYAFVAYQTAYLKAHYPSEYMAAVLNNQNNIEKISFFMEECRKIGVRVLGPDVNESDMRFNVNKKKEIRFGLSGVKGVGDKAVENIIEERKENGPYTSIYDFARRINSRTVSKKVYENLVYSGAFDCFNLHRAQFFFIPPGTTQTGIDRLVKYTSDFQHNENNSAMSLFGGTSDADIPEPTLADCPDWDLIIKLKYEKDVIGIYLTGHPLDNYRVEMDHFCTDKVEHLHLIDKIKGEGVDQEVVESFNRIKNKEILIGGLVSSVQHRTTRNGKPFGIFVFEDYTDSYEIAVFGEEYVKFKGFLNEGYFLQLRATIRERFGQKDNWELKLLNILLLDELREKLTKSVTIQLSLNEISPGFLMGLKELVERNAESEGLRNCELKFKILDYEDEIRLDMPSKNIRVNPDNDFLEGLERMNVTNFRLN